MIEETIGLLNEVTRNNHQRTVQVVDILIRIPYWLPMYGGKVT